MAIIQPWNLNLIGGGGAELVSGAEASTNFMQVLGLDPVFGRGFEPGDARVGKDGQVVMLTYEWWQTRFASDPAIIGRKINLSQIQRTVIGVLPPRALIGNSVSWVVPLVIEGAPWRVSVDSLWAPVTARLKPGVTIGEAGREIAGITRRYYAGLPQSVVPYTTELVPLQAHLAAKARPALILLVGAVAVLLAIVCANVANLLLARASLRRKEIAVRAALGASAGRMIRQVFTESLLLAMLGGLLGLVVAALGIVVLNRMTDGALPGMMRPAVDLQAAGFCLLIACGTGFILGLLPALQACKTDGSHWLKDVGNGSTSGSRTATQSLLVTAEVAMTLMLVIDGGLLLRSYSKIVSADPGFNPRHTMACDVSLTVSRFESWMSVVRFENEIHARLTGISGVDAVGTSGGLPLRGPRCGPEGLVHGAVRVALADGKDQNAGVEAGLDLVAGDYFSAMGIRLLKGRVLADSDNRLNAASVVVINDQLASLLMPGQNPLGQYLRCTDSIGGRVVGVVDSVCDRQLDTPPDPRVYCPQVINPWDCSVVVRTNLPPSVLVDRIRGSIEAILPDQSVTDFRTLDEDVSRSLLERRVTLALFVVFAMVALGLACLGIYGVVAYAINQRQRELCVRMALGAGRRDVFLLVFRDGLRSGLFGIAAGIAGGAIGARLIADRLYGESTYDPAVFAVATALLALATVVFVYLPARRAASLDPSLVLRSE
jgi:predicted permease